MGGDYVTDSSALKGTSSNLEEEIKRKDSKLRIKKNNK
jgi:hypothetical protein